jgi:hypothetical protein
LRDRTAIGDAHRTGDRGRDFYHSGFEAVTADGRFVIEMTSSLTATETNESSSPKARSEQVDSTVPRVPL